MLIGLDDRKVVAAATYLADKVDLFYLNVSDFMEYSIRNADEMKKICGKKYYHTEESEIIRSLNLYENIFATIPYSLFLNYRNEFSDFFCVYLVFPKEEMTDAVSALVYKERNEFLKEKANYIVPFDENVYHVLLKLLNNTGRIYEAR